MKRILLIAIILTVASHLGATLPLSASCLSAKHHQFDFLVGNWVVRDRSGRVLGTDSVSKEHGGSLIELWREAVSGREGLGVISYRPENDAWHQDLMIHIDFVLPVDGGMDCASMVMTGKEYPGRGVTRIHRLRWTPTSDGLEQLWQTSIDDGQSWQVHFEGVFQRISE
jgi:hypothetical protein